MGKVNPISISYSTSVSTKNIPTQNNSSADTILKNDEFSFGHYNFGNDEKLNRLYVLRKFDELISSVPQKKFSEIYLQIKDNVDFKELINSEYFSQVKGFFRLLDITESLKKQRTEKLGQPKPLCYPLPIDYKQYDLPDYLKFINNLIKSDIPKELKQLYIDTKCADINIYYNVLNYIGKVKNTKELLIKRPPSRY